MTDAAVVDERLVAELVQRTGSEARDRGIQRASSFLEELERLDREGAFRR